MTRRRRHTCVRCGLPVHEPASACNDCHRDPFTARMVATAKADLARRARTRTPQESNA